MIETITGFAVTDSFPAVLAHGEASRRNASTALQNKSERVPSTTDHIPETSMSVRELRALKVSLPR